MRLFVFEDEKRGPVVFKSLLALYFPKETKKESDILFFTFNTGIHKLYKELKETDMSLFRVLQQEDRKRETKKQCLQNCIEDDISEIFLFFDYDFHNKHINLETWNNQISEMLDYFNEETDNGKLYICYPMFEAIRYTKELPDDNYYTYCVDRKSCISNDFKKMAAAFSREIYPNLDFILHDGRIQKEAVMQNWEHLKRQNVCKANYICNNRNDMPLRKSDVTQNMIFTNQLSKYVYTDDCKVAILSGYTLFLYDYLK